MAKVISLDFFLVSSFAGEDAVGEDSANLFWSSSAFFFWSLILFSR